MFFWRRVAPQIPEEGVKPTATPGYARGFRDLNDQVSRGKSFSGYERNSLFLNRKGEGFTDVAGLLAADFKDDARAVATVDWDQDGDLDVWITNRNAPQVRLLRNNHASNNASLSVRLVGNGKTTNRDAIGARLVLSRASDPEPKLMRTVRGGNGFLSQSSAWIHFGLGDSLGEYQLEILWPGGGKQTVSALKPGTRSTIVQGQADPKPTSFATLPLTKRSAASDSTSAAAGKSGFWVANPVPFPELICTDKEGASRSTTDFLGKPVLINLWATWCVPCQRELADLGQHEEALRAQGATVLALNVDDLSVSEGIEGRGTPERSLARAGYNLPWGYARQENLAKIEILIEYLTDQRTPLSIPTSILVDAKGYVAAVYLERVEWEQLSADLALLNDTPAARLKRASPRSGRWFEDPRQLDQPAYLGDFATLYGANGFPKESQRLYEFFQPKEGTQSARESYNQGKAAAEQGLTKQAMEHYRKAIELDPEYGQALTGLGALLISQRRHAEAEPFLERAIRIDPNHATALINLAMIDQAKGDLETAVGRLRGVVTRNPEYLEAHLSLGSVLAAMKQYGEAIRHLSKAVELNPKMTVAHLNLATAYSASDQIEKSEKHFQTAISLSPNMAYPHYGLGNLQVKRNDHASAVESYKRALSLGAVNPQTLTRLGQSLLATGNQEGAVAAFKKALELSPQHAEARDALNRLGIPE